MKNLFKNLVTVVLLLVLSGTAMYGNNSTPSFIDSLKSKSDVVETAALLSQNNNSTFTQNILFRHQVFADSFLFEIEEEEQDVKKTKHIQDFSTVNSVVSKINQHFLKFQFPLNKKSYYHYFSFFKSKTATSLYLLFEVFRI